MAKVLPVPASPTTTAIPSRLGEQAADHLALVGLQGRAGVDHPGGDQLPGLPARLAPHPLGRGERLALQLPDALRW